MLMAWALVGTLSAAAQPKSPEPVLRRKVTTQDGVALALYRYVPAAFAEGQPPVLLVPELGFGRSLFDLDGKGLARFLQARGREVFVLELRGQGASAAPTGWRLVDVVAQDLPAAVDAISALRRGPVDVIAHGYSGGLVLAACARELAGKVGRVVALSTPVLAEVPNPIVARLLREPGDLSRLSAAGAGAKDFELLMARGGNFPSGRLAALRNAGLSALGKTAAAELLGWMEKGDLTLADGSTFKERIARYDRPTLLILPLRNNFAHPEFASPLRELAPAAPVTVRILSKLDLLKEDYTHLSVLHGTDVAADIFTPALRFLTEEGLARPLPPGVQQAQGTTP